MAKSYGKLPKKKRLALAVKAMRRRLFGQP